GPSARRCPDQGDQGDQEGATGNLVRTAGNRTHEIPPPCRAGATLNIGSPIGVCMSVVTDFRQCLLTCSSVERTSNMQASTHAAIIHSHGPRFSHDFLACTSCRL